MQFYRIEAAAAGAAEFPQSRDSDEFRSMAGAFLEKSESFYRKEKDCYIFAVETRRRSAVFGAVLRANCDVAARFEKYGKAAGMDFSDIKVEEIVLKTMMRLLSAADRADFIAESDEVLRHFGLDGLSRNRRSAGNYDETLLDGEADKARLFDTARGLLAEETLVPELERIYRGRAFAKAYGHPVHYLLNCTDCRAAKKLCETLLLALYANGRICNRRYVTTGWEPDSSEPDESYDALYQSCEGGAVVVEYLAADGISGPYPRAGSDVVVKLCETAKKYRNSVLTVFNIADASEKAENAFLDNLEDMTIIGLHDDIVSDERAKDYLRQLARKSHIRADKALFSLLNAGSGYTAKDLGRLFSEWYGNKLKTSVYPQYSAASSVKKERANDRPRGRAIDELNKMVGLDEAKAVIARALNYCKAQKLFADRGLGGERPAMHMVFTGNPGTAKTTVARLFAQIMKDNGVLSQGDLCEVGRADLVGKYVGWTAQLVKQKFKAARGSVLFIDEAYSLLDGENGLYGDEAINTIVQEMENNRDNMVVIFAGYPDKMEKFLQSNPGLRSRIAFTVPFADYDAAQLCDISDIIAEKNGFTLAPEAREKLRGIFETAMSSPDFGNGRFARNLIDNARMEQAGRLLAIDAELLSEKELREITAADIVPPAEIRKAEVAKIGFGRG